MTLPRVLAGAQFSAQQTQHIELTARTSVLCRPASDTEALPALRVVGANIEASRQTQYDLYHAEMLNE